MANDAFEIRVLLELGSVSIWPKSFDGCSLWTKTARTCLCLTTAVKGKQTGHLANRDFRSVFKGMCMMVGRCPSSSSNLI